MSVTLTGVDEQSVGVLSRWLSPLGVHLACRVPPITRQREWLVPQATGDVLELGVGTGLNLPHYDGRAVRRLVAVDPSAPHLLKARTAAARCAFDVELRAASAEALPWPSSSFDTVVVTYSLCSIPSPELALAEAHRVLRPGGRLLFSEHGLADTTTTAAWQRRLEPAWVALSGGCHLTRDAPSLIRAAGFEVDELSQGALRRVPSVLGFNSRGVAHK